ncbi:glycoside hydrolase domain-containing protein [Ornithinibacillus halophilus]|uniref:Rv2525c-like glycoside hydrolase-like domain-containing protein n=1 Tax=Ornithinibacillus halophilus TaxID=930117 RepID=A0A1M5NTL5_9BACI|nr:glycoside hydrolase domain-containing protein [Ornithinibacillus halophilus]SHG92872.1 protein of unknown function [Ornithinibacillus halophilus]
MIKKHEIFTLVVLAVVIAIPIIYAAITGGNAAPPDQDPPQEDTDNSNGEDNGNDNGSDSGNGSDNDSDENSDQNGESGEIVWGVDSASYTSEELFACVIDNFGEPEVWGRYLGDREGVSAGLDSAEVDYLHENDIQILVIYNHVNDARGYDHGVEHGEQAIQFAEDLGVPEGVALFVDIEPDYPVDAEFMDGWYDALSDSNYEPGVYGVFTEDSELFQSYTAMEDEVQENMVVWTAYPQAEITTKENAPEFNPQGPESAMVYGWQYAIDAETCNIDTNLFRGEMSDFLW